MLVNFLEAHYATELQKQVLGSSSGLALSNRLQLARKLTDFETLMLLLEVDVCDSINSSLFESHRTPEFECTDYAYTSLLLAVDMLPIDATMNLQHIRLETQLTYQLADQSQLVGYQ